MGSRLSEDWKPSESDVEYGRALMLTDAQIKDIAEDMRLWALANAHRQVARKENWSMAFKGWMRREAKKVNPHGKPPNNPGSLVQAADRLIDKAKRGEFTFGPRPGRPPVAAEPSQTAFRLLPPRRSD